MCDIFLKDFPGQQFCSECSIIIELSFCLIIGVKLLLLLVFFLKFTYIYTPCHTHKISFYRFDDNCGQTRLSSNICAVMHHLIINNGFFSGTCHGLVCTYDLYIFLHHKQLWRYSIMLQSKLVKHQNTGFYGIYKTSNPVIVFSLCSATTTQGFQVYKFSRTPFLMSNYYGTNTLTY